MEEEEGNMNIAMKIEIGEVFLNNPWETSTTNSASTQENKIDLGSNEKEEDEDVQFIPYLICPNVVTLPNPAEVSKDCSEDEEEEGQKIVAEDDFLKIDYVDPLSVFECEDCDLKFVQKADLISHSKVHKTPAYREGRGKRKLFRYACRSPDCEKRFSSSFSRVSHEFNIHQLGTKPYKCSQCEYSTFRTDHLKKHKVTHDNPFNTKCLSMSSEQEMIVVDNIESEMLASEITIDTKPDMSNSRQRSQGRSLLRYLCRSPDCEKRFSSSYSRVSHEFNIHKLGAKTIKCHLCQYSTLSNQHLRIHLAVHAKGGNTWTHYDTPYIPKSSKTGNWKGRAQLTS